MTAPTEDSLYTYRAVVRGNYDGDTVRVDVDLGLGIWAKGPAGKGVALRLIGVDAPEIRSADAELKTKAKAAQRALNKLIPPGSQVTIRTVKDAVEKYGRYLAIVWTAEGTNVNDAMVREGFADVYLPAN